MRAKKKVQQVRKTVQNNIPYCERKPFILSPMSLSVPIAEDLINDLANKLIALEDVVVLLENKLQPYMGGAVPTEANIEQAPSQATSSYFSLMQEYLNSLTSLTMRFNTIHTRLEL